MTIHVRPAAVADVPCLSQLGATTFRETYEGENTPEDMERHLAEVFTPERQAAEIDDPAATVLLGEHRGMSGDAALVGYAYLVSGPAPAAVRGPAPLELKRLYVARAWHGRGVAQALMDAALDAARARGAETLWLGDGSATRARCRSTPGAGSRAWASTPSCSAPTRRRTGCSPGRPAARSGSSVTRRGH